MKLVITLLLTWSFTLKGYPQTDLLNSSQLMTVLSFYRTSFKSSVDVVAARGSIDKYLRATYDQEPRKGFLKEQEFLKQKATILKSTFESFQDPAVRFAYESQATPFRVVTHRGQVCLALTGIVSDQEYNTLKLNATKRACDALAGVGLPAAKGLSYFAQDSLIKHLAFSVLYRAANFGREKEGKGEAALVIANPEDMKAYANKEISEGEFFRRSEIYVCDRDAISEFRRIEHE